MRKMNGVGISLLIALLAYKKEHQACAFPTVPGSCNSPNPLGDAHILVAFEGGTELSEFGLDVRIDNKTLVTGIPFVIQAKTEYTISLQVSDASFPFRGFLLRLAGDTVDARDYLSTDNDLNIQEFEVCHTFFASGLGHISNDLKRMVSGVLYVDDIVSGLTLEATVVIRNGAVRGSEFYLSSYTLDAVAAVEQLPVSNEPSTITDAPVVAPSSMAPVTPMPVTTSEAPVVVPSSTAPVTSIVTTIPVITTEVPVATPSSAAPAATSMPVLTTEIPSSDPSSMAPATLMPATTTTDAPNTAAPSSMVPVIPMPVTSAPSNMTSGALPLFGVTSMGMIIAVLSNMLV